MAATLQPTVCADAYPADNATGAILMATGSIFDRIDIIVQTADIAFSFLSAPSGSSSGGYWTPDHYLPVGNAGLSFVSLDRMCQGIRFRNGVPKSNATVICWLADASEIPYRPPRDMQTMVGTFNPNNLGPFTYNFQGGYAGAYHG